MEFELKLKEEEINYILMNLADKPYGQVFELINKIQIQGESQLKSINGNNDFYVDAPNNGV